MRAIVALALSAVLFALSWAPHVHHGVEGDHDCPACIARTADAAHYETPDVAPVRVTFVGLVVVAPVEPAPTGAPLGAIPGQSPPAIA
jgi:hypothetical protein